MRVLLGRPGVRKKPVSGLRLRVFGLLLDQSEGAVEVEIIRLAIGASEVVAGHAVAAVVERVKALKADLLVVGFMGHSALYERARHGERSC